MMLYDVLKASKGLYVNDSFAMLWGKQLGGWTVSTITGTLPMTFRSNGTALIDYRIYGTANGAGVQTAQLFDKTTVTDRHRIGSDGAPYPDPRCKLSDYIEVLPNIAYAVNTIFTHDDALAQYDADKTFVERTVSGSGSFTTTSSTKYVRISMLNDNANTKMLTEGSTPPETYIPYGYKLPLKLTSGTESKDTDIYIGDSKLLSSDYVDYESGKIVRNGTPQDPPLPFPELETFEGTNTLDSTEALGEVTIKGMIKGA